MMEIDLRRLEDCMAQLAADLSARSEPWPKPKPGDGDVDDAVPF